MLPSPRDGWKRKSAPHRHLDREGCSARLDAPHEGGSGNSKENSQATTLRTVRDSPTRSREEGALAEREVAGDYTNRSTWMAWKGAAISMQELKQLDPRYWLEVAT